MSRIVVVGRWIAGLGVGAISLLVPMYQSESASRQIRGALIRHAPFKPQISLY